MGSVQAPETSMGPGHAPGLVPPRLATGEDGVKTRRTPICPGPKRDDLPVVRILDILSRKKVRAQSEKIRFFCQGDRAAAGDGQVLAAVHDLKALVQQGFE
jgi:hypothetical protein